jgi:hypothetical protein
MGTILIVLAGAITLGAFLAIVGASALVTGAVHYEELRKSLNAPAPGPCTRAARRLLATPTRKNIPASQRSTGCADGSSVDPRTWPTFLPEAADLCIGDSPKETAGLP